MFPDKFFDVVKMEGVVSIVSWVANDAHVVNTRRERRKGYPFFLR